MGAIQRGGAGELSRKGLRGTREAHELQRRNGAVPKVPRQVYTIFRICQEVNGKSFGWLRLGVVICARRSSPAARNVLSQTEPQRKTYRLGPGLPAVSLATRPVSVADVVTWYIR